MTEIIFGRSLVLMNVFLKSYFAEFNGEITRLANVFLAGFQCCSAGFSSGEHFGKYLYALYDK